MGVESNGMVLAASPDGGKPMLRQLRRGAHRHENSVESGYVRPRVSCGVTSDKPVRVYAQPR